MDTVDDNLSKQVDEIEALSAIYRSEWKTEDESYRTYSATVTEGGREIILLITIPPEYPSNSPPYYMLTAPWMKSEEKDSLYAQLEEVYGDHVGESMIHLWIEKVREYLQSRSDSDQAASEAAANQERESLEKNSLEDVLELEGDCPLVSSAEPFTDRKSTFQGHAAAVTSVKQVKQILAKLRENRKIAQATHNIFAYRIYNEESKLWLQDCEDDGEDHAGGRLMHLLQILDVKNVLVVVSRWFGGILLGGDRFKYINNAARDALELGGHINCTAGTDDTSKKSKSKKK